MNVLSCLFLASIVLNSYLAASASPLRYEPKGLRAYDSSLKRLLNQVDAKQVLKYKGTSRDKNCVLCKTIVAAFIPVIRNTANQLEYDVLFKLAQVVCTALNIESKSVCYQVIPQYSEEIAYLINYGVITEDDICTILLRSTCGTPYNKNIPWNVTLPGDKPPPYNWKAPAQGAPTLRVLHLSDVHIDVKYVPGALADCKDPQCCHADNGVGNASTAAGFWGDYRNCDTPLWTTDAFFRWLADRQDTFDVIYWTGDLPPHHVWNQTASEQLTAYSILMDFFHKYLPNKIVYPAVGNHESAPADSFPPHYVAESHRNQWLYDALAKHWSTWLDPEAIETVRYAAFYSTLVKPGFRVISLNTQFADSDNFWLRINDTDPDGMLSWMIGELLKAEGNGERVHILGHIPGSSQMSEFSRNLYRIVNRFEATIGGLFFGHTHQDHFEMYYEREEASNQHSSASPRPIATSYIAPSLTPYNFLNPGYRVYDIDGIYADSTFGVVGWTQYVMNLSDANLRNNTAYFQEYDTRKEYQLSTAFPADMDRLADTFWSNKTAFDMFYSYKYKLSPLTPPCDASCRQSVCCELHSAQAGDSEYCNSKLHELHGTKSKQLVSSFQVALHTGLDRARRSLRRAP